MKAKRFLTISEVAYDCLVSPNTVRNWIQSGKLVALDVSGRPDVKQKTYVISVQSYEKFLSEYSTDR